MELLGRIISFLLMAYLVNFLADVLPYKRKLTRPFCHGCDQNIGFFSYLLPKRICKKCNFSNSIRSVLVIIVSVLVAIWLSFFPPDSISFPWAMLWAGYFGLIVVIDLEHKLILHITSYAGLVIGVLFGLLRGNLTDGLIGGVVGYGIMLVFYLFGGLFVKVMNRGREEQIDEIPLGYGDVNLAGIVGLVLGFPGIATGLILAVFSAGFVSLVVYFITIGKGRSTTNLAIPYGPFLTIGIWLALLI